MRFTVYQESRIGKRKSNQDRVAYCYSRDALLMVVADGMGGHLHGEVAAQIAVQYITEAFQREATPTLRDPFGFLAAGLNNAHNAVLDYTLERDLPDAPRTTCVACVIQNSIAYWAHAGDSRLYLIRGDRPHSQTHDHSRVQLMVDDGLITEAEAMNHPGRNRVYSCLGGTIPPQIDFSAKTALHTGDIIVMATDGFWGPLGTEALVRGFAGRHVVEITPRLMDDAEVLGGRTADNLSVIAVTWEDGYGDITTGSVQTQTMPITAHTTQMEGFDKARLRESDLTDDDIEKAIEEIRSAIHKYSK
jgi:serine/threonine protein phosphatase PrpC